MRRITLWRRFASALQGAVSGMWSWLEQLKARVIDGRRYPRRIAEPRPAVLSAACHDHQVRVIDMSDVGAMIEADIALDAGTRVILRLLDREPLEGQVRWSRDSRIGLSFGDAAQSARESRDEQ